MSRAAGESSIHRGADGRWHGYVSMGQTDNGKRDRRHVSGPRRAVVVEKVRALEQRRDAGIVMRAGDRATVGQWLGHWLETIAAPRLRPSSMTHYRVAIERHLEPKIGHHRLDRLQPEHIEDAYARLAAEGLGAPSILYAHRVLSRALKVATQRGRVARNVAALVEPPRVIRHEVQPLTAEEARRVLAAAAELRNAPRWSVALALGLRQGEALGLTWADVDLEAGTLTVRRALQRRKGEGLVFTEPKSAAGRRSIALPRQLVAALRLHRSRQVEERLAAGQLWEDYGVVFAQTNGRPIDPSADYKSWRALLERAGVRAARLHDARHTAATLLLQQGVPARVAMQILGHSQISLTLGTYSHVVPELASDAAERMGSALWGSGGTAGADGNRTGTGSGVTRGL